MALTLVCWKHRKKLSVLLLLIFSLYFLMYQNLPSEVSSENDWSVTAKIREIKTNKESITRENLHERVTVILREFEEFDNTLPETIEALETFLPRVKIFIIADRILYPPVKLDTKGFTQIFTLSSDLSKNYSRSSCLTAKIETDYTLFLPDGVRVSDWTFIKTAAAYLSKKGTTAVAIPVSQSKLGCSDITVDHKRWTLTVHPQNGSDVQGRCSVVTGIHGVFMYSETFQSLSEPWSRPFPHTFYIQAKAKVWKTRILKSAHLYKIKDLYMDSHIRWKHKQAESNRIRMFYKTVGIKREVLVSGMSKYYGCDKDSARCFGTVLNDMPRYLYEGRWTPPCCLKALRETASHVFNILEKCTVRYWLEGGSLLGAARHNDIIPWDYDVDIGIYKEDIAKCTPLQSAEKETFTDENEFVWEKAAEGEFFRVQYSDVNHLHVDIYPFYSRNGTMTKDSWFPTHRQDAEFPEKFLKPLIKIEFAGVWAGAPNNVRTFLEYKFGEGVIDNPRYPNYQKPN